MRKGPVARPRQFGRKRYSGNGRHRRIGLGCPGGSGGMAMAAYAMTPCDDPAHQRKVIAEHFKRAEKRRSCRRFRRA